MWKWMYMYLYACAGAWWAWSIDYVCIGNISCSISAVYTEHAVSQPPRGCVIFLFFVFFFALGTKASRYQDDILLKLGANLAWIFFWKSWSNEWLLEDKKRQNDSVWKWKNVWDHTHSHLFNLFMSHEYKDNFFLVFLYRVCVMALFSRYWFLHFMKPYRTYHMYERYSQSVKKCIYFP